MGPAPVPEAPVPGITPADVPGQVAPPPAAQGGGGSLPVLTLGLHHAWLGSCGIPQGGVQSEARRSGEAAASGLGPQHP